MTEIEHAVLSGAIVGRAALRPGQAFRLALRLAALGFAISLAAPMAVAEPTPDADLPAATDSRPMDAEGAGNRLASHSDGAGALGEEPKSPKGDSPATDTALLVAEGESIPDIDKIIEALDRRAPVSAVAFSPDGALIASGSEDHMVRVWHLPTGRLLRRLDGHSSAVTAVAFSPDGSTIASASNDRTCLLYTSPSPRDYAASRMPSSA